MLELSGIHIPARWSNSLLFSRFWLIFACCLFQGEAFQPLTLEKNVVNKVGANCPSTPPINESTRQTNRIHRRGTHLWSEESSQSSGSQINGEKRSDCELNEVDVLYDRKSALVYDERQQRYVKQSNSPSGNSIFPDYRFVWSFFERAIPRLTLAFLPTGVTPNYYTFCRWRVVQRFINANLNVIGTQSLLLGLGIQATGAGKLAALTTVQRWVLKDALGKVTRMMWASKMGRKFDSDCKRWRFRSSFVYALGNGLEIATYLSPSLFLVWATLANCCKQISMLTSSSTRMSIYNSFRDGTRENISDITAKGEAQIAIVDLVGITSGVIGSRILGTDIRAILTVYAFLQSLEILCVYREMRTVCYKVLNFERLKGAIRDFLDQRVVSAPEDVAATERIFWPPRRLDRRALAFGSLGRAKLSPDELNNIMNICKNERFLLIVGPDVKNQGRPWRGFFKGRLIHRYAEHCHIVLHKEASNVDIVKSTLALALLRRDLENWTGTSPPRSSDCYAAIKKVLKEADRQFPSFLKLLGKQGWESPARFMFGRVHMRAEWPLEKSTANSKTQSQKS